jgi:hypothetical protein
MNIPNFHCWNFLCNYINSYELESTIKRKDIIKEYKNEQNVPQNVLVRTSTLDNYILILRRLFVLETIKNGVYMKRQNIPKTLEIGRARTLAYNTQGWKQWFIKLEDKI